VTATAPAVALPDRFRLDGVELEVTRAWPGRHGDVAFEVRRPDGRTTAARWFPDAADADRARRRTPGSRALGSNAVLHAGGADRRLPGLAPLLAAGGDLVVHRPERRAVVRTGAGFRKLVRPERAAALTAAHGRLRRAVGDRASVPRVIATHEDGVTLAALPGRSLTDLGQRAVDADRMAAAWHRVGEVLATMAATSPAGLTVHDAVAEAEVTRTAVERAVAGGRLDPAALHGPVTATLDALVAGSAPTTAVAHRDLHDGQVLVAGDRTGLLDPDTLAAAEPALDLANLLVHLELRVAQGLLRPDHHRRAADALLEGAAPTASTLARVPAHAAAVRLRLAAVYAWRPRWRALAARWWPTG
jgi:hypothetical protein